MIEAGGGLVFLKTGLGRPQLWAVRPDGGIYCFSQEGKTTVLRPQPRYEVLAENRLDDGFMASPAVVAGALLRTKTDLSRIEKP